jgi:peptide/nickel transport system substrate-binding protein
LTVIVNYKAVAPTFASTLFTFGILPKHRLQAKNLNSDEYNEKPLGTGPFMVTEFRRGQYVVCDRNPNYWRRNSEGASLPYLDRIIFKIIPDTNTLMTQLRSGEVQFASSVPYALAAQLRTLPNLELVPNETLSWYHFDFNFAGPEPLRDLRVRQAIAHSVNKTAIARALGGFPKPIKSPVVPLLAIHSPDTPDYPYDVIKANDLLDAAGYARGKDGIRAKEGKRLSFSIVGQAGKAEDQLVEQILSANMLAIGVELKLDNKAGVAFREARYKGAFDILFGRWITSPETDYSIFFGTKGANNGQGYSNPSLDAVFAELRHTLEPAERRRLAAKFQNIVADDVVTVPLTTNPQLIVKTKALQNFVPNPTNMTDFVDSSGWWLKQ